MDKTRITCPRCKGCGKVKPVKKRIISYDPSKKWCGKCEMFLPLDCFYANTSSCKTCHCTKSRKRRYNPDSRKKYNCVCNVCGIQFLGYRKEQVYCSRKCNCNRLTIERNFYSYEDIPDSIVDAVNEREIDNEY